MALSLLRRVFVRYQNPYKVAHQRYVTQRIFKIASNPRIREKDAGESKTGKVTPFGWLLLIVPLTTFALGCWQVQRKVWKERLIQELEQKTNMEPVDLLQNIENLPTMEYRKVKVFGRFLHDKELLMGPRSLITPSGEERQSALFSTRDTCNGYLVVTPFQLSDTGEIILVNRGWVSRNHIKPKTRKAAQIKYDVELVGVYRKGETRPQFTPDHKKGDIFLYRDLKKMCSLTGAKPIFLDAVYETSVPGGPIGGQTRVTLRNEHLSYLITWFSLSAITSAMWFRQIVKGKPF